ncbi:histidine decarboxylase [Phytohabitans sp. ZYX-F-186]|uniref:Histidine decarboxylase n=1 Tax=Phytohabitans maris TaxID=3071409 RepID=A0ABU0ZCA0_9ACTN|nr:histidine decarboxylase [Phytohabitans sp. ZYX-F-186]MDQ7904681.1 histidine decarboxylase [Phytohabitans sp. ZYX-F-186]
MSVDLTGLPAFADRLRSAGRYNIGFPGATDIDHTDLSPWWGRMLNNVGDAFADGLAVNHSKVWERQVLRFVADLLRAPTTWWGYVTSGASEGTLHALHQARRRFPTGVVYHSVAAHPSVAKAVDLLGMDAVVVRAGGRGEMDYHDLATVVGLHRDRPAVVVATAGTTLDEAVDDLRQIHAVLDEAAVVRRLVHVDAALAGIPLALLEPQDRSGIDFADGADSVVVSGHKFLGAPMPCGILITATPPAPPTGVCSYSGSPDTTVSGSRNGHTPLLLAHTISRLGRDGLHGRAVQARRLAGYTVRQLTGLGWPAWRHRHAFTVVLRTPPAPVLGKWVLAGDSGERCHIVCMPGVSAGQIDEFVSDLHAALTPTPGSSPLSGLDGADAGVPVPARRMSGTAVT